MTRWVWHARWGVSGEGSHLESALDNAEPGAHQDGRNDSRISVASSGRVSHPKAS